MQEFWSNLALDILIPNQCIICQELSKVNLCDNCMTKIPNKPTLWIKENIKTNIIFTPKPNTKIQSIDKDSTLNCILTCTDFKNSIVKKGVHYLKYKNLPQLAKPLGTIMLRAFSQHFRKGIDVSYLCPIPLYTSRLKFRGYNQANLLANYLHKELKTPLYTDIQRIRNTPQQMRIQNRQNRIENVNNAFKAMTKGEQNQTIILIDDVTTTLSTIQQTAKALQKQGFSDINALILAH